MTAAPLAHARAATADPRLIIPLDVPTVGEARALIERLGEAVSFYKIGLQLFATGGMALAAELKAQGKQVFLDWKLHDIGATVEKAAAAIAEAGSGDLVTVHAEPQVLAAAVRGRSAGILGRRRWCRPRPGRRRELDLHGRVMPANGRPHARSSIRPQA